MISLTQTEACAILRALLFLAKVDGDISDNEFKIIRQLKDIYGCKNFDLIEEFKNLSDHIGEILKDLKRKEAKKALLKTFIHFCYCDGAYTASERLMLYHIVEGLGAKPELVFKIEQNYAHEAQKALEKYAKEHPQELGEHSEDFSWQKMAMTAGLVVGGGAALAATGGLLAPVVGGIIGTSIFGLTGAAASSAGLAALGGGAIATGGGGMAAGGAVVSSLLGLGGIGLGAKTGWNLFGDLEEFEPIQLTPHREACHQLLCIHGFMQQNARLEDMWSPVVQFDQYSDVYGLRWESKTLANWSEMLQQVRLKISAGNAAAAMAARATKAAGGLVVLPVTIASAFSLIDNPWHVARNRAELAGKELAIRIMNLPSPISLIGYSLGSRVIAYALEYLEKNECYGKIFDVYFMGGAVSKNHQIFRKNNLEKLVVNNAYNFYSKKDWVLTYLYQTAELGDKPIGLMQIESSRVINIDATHIIDGHLQYPSKIKQLLALCTTQKVQQAVYNPNNQTATDKAIQILKKTEGMTNADPHDFNKAKYFCHLSDMTVVMIWKNNFNVHHVFLASTEGELLFGCFVGWIHTDGLYQSLEEIQQL